MKCSDFFETFPSLEERKCSTANHCEPTYLSSRLFEGQLQFLVKKEPQKDHKKVEKLKFLAIV